MIVFFYASCTVSITRLIQSKRVSRAQTSGSGTAGLLWVMMHRRKQIMKESESLIHEIVSLIEIWEPKLSAIPEIILSGRRNNQNRSVKQILGHLIDSTSNNIHRVVHLQYQKSPFEFPNYASSGNNDRWIAIQNYQNEDWKALIQLWKYSLLHYCHVIKNIDASRLENEWIAGPDRKITLRTLLGLFLEHIKLHLSEIDELIER